MYYDNWLKEARQHKYKCVIELQLNNRNKNQPIAARLVL